MSATLQNLLAQVRANIDEPTPRFWTDAELTSWINDGLRDVARRSEDVLSINSSLTAIVGQASYAAPTDLIRLHRVEFQPTSSTQVYPIDVRERNEADQFMGFNPSIQSAFPYLCWLWGTTGVASYALTISFYPVFSQAGTISIWYYRMPSLLVNMNDPVELPNGWEDLPVLFATAMARRKGRDPLYQIDERDYERRLTNLIDVSRRFTDAPGQLLAYGGNSYWNMGYYYGWDG
jgi:hypothetical protein